MNKTNFKNAWEDLGEENELEDTYELSAMKSLPEAIKQILQHLGMQPCERSDKVPDGKSAHQLFMAGKNDFSIIQNISCHTLHFFSQACIAAVTKCWPLLSWFFLHRKRA